MELSRIFDGMIQGSRCIRLGKYTSPDGWNTTHGGWDFFPGLLPFNESDISSVMQEIKKLESELTALRALNEELVLILTKVEWAGEGFDCNSMWQECPCCSNREERGHDKDCVLKAILTKAKEESDADDNQN